MIPNVPAPTPISDGRISVGRQQPWLVLAGLCVLEPPEDTLRQARAQLARWFRADVSGWRLLRIEEIRHALPAQRPSDLAARPCLDRGDGLFLAGDWVTEGSIDGAMRSGRAAADAVCDRLGR